MKHQLRTGGILKKYDFFYKFDSSGTAGFDHSLEPELQSFLYHGPENWKL